MGIDFILAKHLLLEVPFDESNEMVVSKLCFLLFQRHDIVVVM